MRNLLFDQLIFFDIIDGFDYKIAVVADMIPSLKIKVNNKEVYQGKPGNYSAFEDYPVYKGDKI
jgi:hypothetical protein